MQPVAAGKLGPLEYCVVKSWGPVALILLVAPPDVPDVDGDRVELAFWFQDEPTEQLWALSAILKNWVCRLNERYLRTQERAPTARLAHADKVVAWVTSTRAYATDLRAVYGDRIADLLQDAAAEVEQAVSWPTLRLEAPPDDPKALAALFLTVDLWAWDQVRETLLDGKPTPPGVPGWDAGRTKLLSPALEILKGKGLPYMASDEGWKMRVRRLKIKPGQQDNLMADVLSSLRSGPYDASGREVAYAKKPAS